MSISFLFLCLLGLGAFSFLFGRRRIRGLTAMTGVKQHSRDVYHGSFVVICAVLLPLIILLAWSGLSPLLIDAMLEDFLRRQSPDLSIGEMGVLIAKVKAYFVGSLPEAFADELIRNGADYFAALVDYSTTARSFVVLLLSLCGAALGLRLLAPRFTARPAVERVFEIVMIVASAIAILTTIGIVLSLIFETLRFFDTVPVMEFLFGLSWSPQIAIREDQVGGSGSFGAIPLFAGTMMITFIAMLVAVPIGLMSAVYLSEYANPKLRGIAKPGIEILAGIPTVVYGFFAALMVAPFLRDSGAEIGLTLSSESALAAGLVMGIMIIPFISSLSDDVINAVPQTLRDGAAALGATQSETICQVVLPAALPGIVSAILLAMSRAIGETMIVVMAAGVAANLTANPFESVTTVTVQIVMLLVGDQEFDSAKTLAAFALGLVLFFITLLLNVLALYVVNRFKEQYD
ncbi:MAG: Phosphate transport system permease protein PstC 1 [Alphaproteobacteria bacterium]|nr:MAG: Phosphate transport system permease protein PstC 1 [Alphaproteobacteria bacterium]